MQLTAIKFIRKMRGGAQAHLIECDDGHFYVVKFQNNPQHRRVLFNEWLASSLLIHLQISTPHIAVVNVSAEFLTLNPDVHIQLRWKRLAVEPGQHFGSRYQGEPPTAIVYDFVPDVLLDSVVNSNDFRGALVLDKWTANADARQAVFTRTGRPDGSTSRRGLLASMIDQGCAFGDNLWNFMESPRLGLYYRPTVYRDIRSLEDFRPWLDRVVNFSPEALFEVRSQIPAEWVFGDEDAADSLMLKLLRRRKRVPDLIAECAHDLVNVFPEWRDPGNGNVR